MVAITVSTPGKPTINIDFAGKHPSNVTVRDLKSAIQVKIPKFVANRQRLTFDNGVKPTVLKEEAKTLADYEVPEGAKLRLKDLGKQVGYRWLYIWEYSGVILINPALYVLSQYIWGSYIPSTLQVTARNLIVIHFVKRLFESIFVHSFSRETLPLIYVFRNSLFYWGQVGFLMGITLYRPAYSATALRAKGSILANPTWITFWTIWILVSEALNLYAHLHLATLRVPAGQPRKYPTGYGFGYAVCANYWFETLQLLGLVMMTGGDIGTIAYAVVGTYFMQLWAGQKYARYKREFDPKVFPGKRWKMFPPVY